MKIVQDTKPNSERTARERILQTAHDLFYRDGIRATGIDRIIEQAHVTKVTFYRHFPSKNDLVAAYLDYRHQHWIKWFTTALAGAPRNSEFLLEPVLLVLKEWFDSPEYRGCAFINGVVELDGAGAWVSEVSLRHKQDMVDAVATLLADKEERASIALAAAMAIDGAIIRVQMEKTPGTALAALELIFRSLCDAHD